MDLLNNAVRDGARTSEHSFNNLADIPSRPDVDRLFSRQQTSSTETSENSVGVTGTVVLVEGKHGFLGRGRNTEAKNLF